MPSVIGTSTLQVEESKARIQVEEGFELSANPSVLYPSLYLACRILLNGKHGNWLV